LFIKVFIVSEGIEKELAECGPEKWLRCYATICHSAQDINGLYTTAMSNFQAIHDPTAALNLQRLFVLRNIAIICALAAVTIASQVLAMELPLLPLLLTIAVHGVINILTLLRMRKPRPVSSWEFFVQLVLDTLVLCALLYFAGGSTNPFVSLFLLPLVIVASILPQRFTWAMAVLTVGCYSLLIYFFQPLPHANIKHGVDFDLHVTGMWFSFLLSAGLIVFFVVRMANSLRERDRILTETREQAIRDQHLVTLGTLATGAAHELGTPLATMAVLVGELRHEHANDPEVLEKTKMLRSQLDRCKSILSSITASAGQVRPEGGRSFAIDDYLEVVVGLLRSSRPAAKVSCQLEGSRPTPQILADTTLTQALLNVLNNAADASIDSIEVKGRWNNEHLTLSVCDRGEGLNPSELAAAGTPFFTTKPDGQGLGLYLARAVMERFGGKIQLLNQNGGGTQAVIELPLVPIRVPT